LATFTVEASDSFAMIDIFIVIYRVIQNSPYIGINCIGICLRRWLDRQFPSYRFGCHGHVQWPPCSADLTPLGFYFWDHLKTISYQLKLQNQFVGPHKKTLEMIVVA
jgi:hypothetical protein